MDGATQAATEGQAERQSELGELSETAFQIRERIEALSRRVRGVNQRVFGDHSDKVEEDNSPKLANPGQIGGLKDHLRDVHDALTELDDAIGKTERL